MISMKVPNYFLGSRLIFQLWACDKRSVQRYLNRWFSNHLMAIIQNHLKSNLKAPKVTVLNCDRSQSVRWSEICKSEMYVRCTKPLGKWFNGNKKNNKAAHQSIQRYVVQFRRVFRDYQSSTRMFLGSNLSTYTRIHKSRLSLFNDSDWSLLMKHL